MRNKKMMLAGIITVMMGISIVGCGNDGKSTGEMVTTEHRNRNDNRGGI